jgi:hypothetical protein
MSQWAAVSAYAQLAGLQYRYADERHARAALSDFLTFAQQMSSSGKAPDAKSLGIDVALAYMRLAALDRKLGDLESQTSNVSRAQETLRAIGIKQTSREDMESFLSRRDAALKVK